MTNKLFTFLALILFTSTASAQTTSTINIGDTDYTLFTGFTTTDGNGAAYEELVDGNTSDYNYWTAKKKTNDQGDFNGGTNAPAYVEFNANAAFIPKGYILTCENEEDDYCKPKKWAVKAKLNIGDAWTTIHSTTTTLGEGKTFQFRCSNDANNKYQYFRLEVYEVGSSNIVELKELELYGFENITYTHLSAKAATCIEVGIKRECYKRNDGKYFSDETGTTELQKSDVIIPMIPHTGVHHEATEETIGFWQCSVCGKYFSDANCSTELTEAQTQVVKYLDINGTLTSLNANATAVTNSTIECTSGWYVVYDDVTISDRINVNGTVNLILCNGATLTASKGITVGSNATFNIYAQSVDESTMGALVATAKDNTYSSAIGGGSHSSPNFGTITINGGKITATTGYNCGAAIGGACYSKSGNIIINGGIVVATALDYTYSAGIGGGNNGYITSITLNGGIITATGDHGYRGPGIGTGSWADGTMTITIGSGIKKIVARGYKADGIGNGDNATTTINVVFKNGNTIVDGDAKDAVFYDKSEGAERLILVKHNITIADNIKTNIFTDLKHASMGETVTLTVTPGENYTISEVCYNDDEKHTITPVNGKYSFTMPDMNVTVSATFLKSLAHSDITTGTIAAQTYTGSAIEPEVTVSDGGKTLVEGTDYTITYSDNTNIGTGKVTVTGKGNYTGTVEKTFTINPAPIKPEENTATATDDISVNSNIKIWSFEKTIFVENASKKIVIVDMAGRIVKTVNPVSDRTEINDLKCGIYIVKTGIKTQKVSL